MILELSLTSFFYSRESADRLAKDFEKLLAQVRRNGDRVILFLDELHGPSLGGGGQPGRGSQIQGLLKAHIAERELQIIAAATSEDYYKYIKSDEIMAANFSSILLNEPEKEEMLNILCGVKKHFEDYYGLRIPDSLFEGIYTLSQRFIPTRAFPDKAIELLDIACSKAALKKARVLDCGHVHQSISAFSKLPIEIVRLDPQAHDRGMLGFLQRGGRQPGQRPRGDLAHHQAGQAGDAGQRAAARGHLPVPGPDRRRQELRRRPHRRVPVRQPPRSCASSTWRASRRPRTPTSWSAATARAAPASWCARSRTTRSR